MFRGNNRIFFGSNSRGVALFGSGCFKCSGGFKCFISLLDQKIGPNRNKIRVFQVFQVFHAFQGRNPNQARSATNQASLRAANQVRNTANLYLQMKLFYEKVGFYEIFV